MNNFMNNPKIRLEKYNTIIFDCDGVLLDSNIIKEHNISKVLEKRLPPLRFTEAINYFTSNNGLPREEKLNRIFEGADITTILQEYNELNLQTLEKAEKVKGIDKVLGYLNLKHIDCYVLSGGDQKELESVLIKQFGANKFSGVFGGPINKSDHISNNIKYLKPVLYFGDSRYDMEIANKNNFDFVFVWSSSQWKDWKKYKSKFTYIIEDFTDLN